MSSIQDQIEKIKAEAESRILALKQEVTSEIVKRLSEAKDRLKAAQAEVEALSKDYEIATGKTITGEKAGIVRRRLSSDEKAKLAESVAATIKSHKEGIKLGAVAKANPGYSPGAIREAVKSLGKSVQTTGNRASTLYFFR